MQGRAMPPQGNSALRRRKVAELKRAIVAAELRLKQLLERLESRKATGQGTATAELLVRDAEKDLARLYRRRQELLKTKPGE
jgi:hypothetical protein